MELQLKIDRDQARTVQRDFFPYMQQLCEMKIREAHGNMDSILNACLIDALFWQIRVLFERKLLTKAVRFTMKFSQAEGIAMYKLCLALPIPGTQYYLIQLRQFIVDTLHKQILEPKNHIHADRQIEV